MCAPCPWKSDPPSCPRGVWAENVDLIQTSSQDSWLGIQPWLDMQLALWALGNVLAPEWMALTHFAFATMTHTHPLLVRSIDFEVR